jgi:hypothetical protein
VVGKKPIVTPEPEPIVSDEEESIAEVLEKEEDDDVAAMMRSACSLDSRPVDDEDEWHIHVSMSQSFSEFGGGPRRHIPKSSSNYSREEVDLRHAEQMKREYGWATPDWVDARLRPTPHGKVLQERGDLVSPITHAKVLIEKGLISWETPVWTNAKLRKTPRGEAIKRAAKLTAEQKAALAKTSDRA